MRFSRLSVAFPVLPLAAAAGQVPTPMTVNDMVLGRPEDFSLAGPGRVCLNITAFDLQQGETAYVDYLGIHFGRLRVIGPQGQVDLHEGESFREPVGPNRIAAESANRMIVRYGRRPPVEYLVFARVPRSPRRDVPVLWVRGTALRGTSRDYGILERISALNEDFSSCTRHFEYGWNFIWGPPEDEPEQ